MMEECFDLTVLFLTKRIQRLEEVLPIDWEDGYNNVMIACLIVNQIQACNANINEYFNR